MSTHTGSSAARLKVNFVALLAGALSIVSTFLPWWGLDFTDPNFGGVTEFFRWSLWSGPSTTSTNPAITLGANPPWMNMNIAHSPVVGVLVICSVVLALLSMFPQASDLLIPNAIISIITPVLYFVIINQAVTAACSGMRNCINGTLGSITVRGGSMMAGYFMIWGYQIGFYLAILTAVIGCVGVWFHRTFLTVQSP